MNIVFEDTFYITAQKLIKKNNLTQDAIDKVVKQFKENPSINSLQFKHITCKRNKNLYSIRIDKYYRILATKIDTETILFQQVLDHKKYDKAIKPQNC